MAGNEPFSFSAKSSSMLPSAEAEIMIPRQENRFGRRRSHAVDLIVCTSLPSLPSFFVTSVASGA